MQDIPAIVQAFIQEICDENGFREKEIDAAVVQAMQKYHWPGNVRELKNVVERMVIMGDERIVMRDLPRDLVGSAPSPAVMAGSNKTLREFREYMESEYIRFKLEELEWNVSQTATVLGIERTNLHKKMKALGIKR